MRRAGAAVIAVLALAATFAPPVWAEEDRARVRTVELHGGGGERPSLELSVRDYRSGKGSFVTAFRGHGFPNEVTAQRVKGSNRHWRIGPNAHGGRHFLNTMIRRLSASGSVRVWAGVYASGGGRLNKFNVTAFDEPTAAIPIQRGGRQ